jgi:hypothetical protein
VRLIVSSATGFRLYRAQVRAGRVGRYLSAQGDALSTLEFDSASERLKAYHKLELDLRTDATVTLTVLANRDGQMVSVYSVPISTNGVRNTIYLPLPPGIRGRLLRLRISASGTAARIYKLRVWARPLNEPQSKWAWEDYPLEESEVLPEWKDIPIPPTPAEFSWADLPVAPTPVEWAWAPFPVSPTPPGQLSSDPAQWLWVKILSVEETPSVWTWVDVPFEVSG